MTTRKSARIIVTVAEVFGWLAIGMSYAEIFDDFPELIEEDIRACLEYAAEKCFNILSDGPFNPLGRMEKRDLSHRLLLFFAERRL